jgi:serine/threonine protein kinase
MKKNFSHKSQSFIHAQRENRRRRYSISSPQIFESRAGKTIRQSDINLHRLSRQNFSKTYSNTNLLFPLRKNSIEKYDILSKLNLGAFGATYLIRDSIDGQMYILKRIDCRLPNQFCQRLFEERRLLGCLKSNYILTLISSYIDMEHNCYSMKFEYINGRTLLHLLRQYRWFEESTVAFYSAQIVLALEYLHELNIIYVISRR